MSDVAAPAEPVAADPKTATESSSLGRWLAVSALIVAVGVGLTLLVKSLPSEGSDAEGKLKYSTPKIRGLPGKVSLSEETTHRFGVQPQNYKGSHTWEFKNAGQGDLVLSKGESTCSCTIANFKDGQTSFTLPPGESTQITLTWETRDAEGKFSKSADIRVSNDRDREIVKFAVEGSVRPAVAVMPKDKVLNVGAIPSDEQRTAKIAVASADRPDLKLLSVTTTRPEEITAVAVPLPEADRRGLEWTAMTGGYLIKVTLKPSKNLGVFAEDVVIATDHPLLKEIRVRVGGRRDGPVTLTPDVAMLHNVDADAGGSMRISVTMRNAPDATLEVAEKPDNLKVQVVPADVRTGTAAKVRQFWVTVTVPPGSEPSIIEDPIVLKSNHPGASRITIPVHITVLQGK